MNNIYLIGMPGCGKSTIAKILAENKGLKLADVDKVIEDKEQMKISNLFTQFGEEYFRKKETDCLREISGENNLIVATGGGIVTRQENIDIMKQSGKVIFIDTPVENIIRNSDLKNRPLLENNIEHINVLYRQRYDKYVEAADYIIENKCDLFPAVEKIEKII